jgi:hypothetical protein
MAVPEETAALVDRAGRADEGDRGESGVAMAGEAETTTISEDENF